MSIKPEEKFSFYNSIIHQTLLPLIVMITSPQMAITLPYLIVVNNSDLSISFVQHSFMSTLSDAWKSVDWYDFECWCLVIALLLWAFISLRKLAGQTFYGPLTSNGFRPEYPDTGFRYYLLSMLITVPIILNFSVLHFYYKIPTLIGILVAFGAVCTLLAYIKGLLLPDPGLCNATNNPIFDFYWGIELYPNIGSVSLKQMIACRFTMFVWQLIVLVAWKANYELNSTGEINWPLTACTLLQTIYLTKFYYFEKGYLHSIDVTVDRFGFYLVWGCIAFFPALFSIPSLYLVKHSPTQYFGRTAFIITMIIGFLFIGLTYWADLQRHTARATNGKCDIWRKPATVIRATYVDDSDVTQRSILLCSGFLGIARHFNYTLELMSVFLYCLPTLFDGNAIPYYFITFEVIVFIHRLLRDENRCAKKYGKFWSEYCKLVPYRLIPYIF